MTEKTYPAPAAGGAFDVKKDAQGNVVFGDPSVPLSDSGVTASGSTSQTGTWDFYSMRLTVTGKNANQGATFSLNGSTVASTGSLTTGQTFRTTDSGTFTSPSFTYDAGFWTKKATTTTITDPIASLSTSGSISTTTPTFTGSGSGVFFTARYYNDTGMTVRWHLTVNGDTFTSWSFTQEVAGVRYSHICDRGTLTSNVSCGFYAHVESGAGTISVANMTLTYLSGMGTGNFTVRRALYERV